MQSARDSVSDLLQVKQEQQNQQQLQIHQNGGANISKDALNSNGSSGRPISFRLKQRGGVTGNNVDGGDGSHRQHRLQLAQHQHVDCTDDRGTYDDFCYEPIERGDDYDDDHWPLWEMTGDGDPWSVTATTNNNTNAASSKDFLDSFGNAYTDVNTCQPGDDTHSSIVECERIFTVPEVYNELTNLSALELRHDREDCSIFNCLAPWRQSSASFASSSHVSLPLEQSANGAFLGTINGRQNTHQRSNPKGVIRRTSMAVQLYLGMPASVRRSFTPSMYKVQLEDDEWGDAGDNTTGGGRKKRASIIGSDHHQIFTMDEDDVERIETSNDNNNNNNNNNSNISVTKKMNRVHFSELKRVLKVRKFTPDEAIQVWFQREDFDHFKAEMTLLIQESEASRELAEIWLDASECERRRSSSELNGRDNSNNSNVGKGARGTAHHTKSRSWWHNYDHSRRGLERYASPGQARQILASYKVALQKVMDEQIRQRMLRFFCIPNAIDPERIAEVYHEYTAWSRDLALAAGASDADAVRTNFDDDNRKTREYYILKQVISSGYKVHKHMPQFMLPKCIQTKGFLDEKQSLYCDDPELARGSKTFLDSIVRKKSQTGEAAREEMSNLHSGDLIGPVSPALAASLQVNEGGGDGVGGSATTGTMSPRHAKGPVKQKSLASKAKNYPFQQ
eukprot:g8103.t1 g8103   contig27:194661-196694(+)